MENGTSATSVHFDTSTAYFSLLPSNLRGSLPPTGTPNYFVSNAQSVYGLDVWKLHVDWATPGNSTFIGPTVVAISPYTSPPSTIPQPAGDALDSLGDRLMMQNQYRNISGAESLWITHTVGSGGVTGPRWYQLNVSGGTIATSPIQFNTYQPDSTYRWMSSLAVDKAGDMALGFSVSSTNLDPGIRYTGRLAGDPLNTLPQGEMTLIAGTGYQNGGFGRWGDYSAMTVDPVDDCTFWYTNEYYTTNGNNWQTRIGSFTFPSCTSNATMTPTPTATLTSTPTNTQTPTTTFTPTQTNTKTPTATFTSTPTNTQTPTTTFTPTQTNTKTPTATFTSTASNTSSPTATFTSTPSYTLTPTATFTFTPSYTPTLTTTINYQIWLPIIFK